MEKISNFKTFSKTSADASAIKLGEENEIKRSYIADKVREVLSNMDISSLSDLTEEQKEEFVNNLFADDEIKVDAEEVSEGCDCPEGECDCVSEEISEAEIKSDSSFRKYAKKLLKKAFGDDFDLDKAEKTIEGLIKKYDEYGAMIGAIKSALSK